MNHTDIYKKFEAQILFKKPQIFFWTFFATALVASYLRGSFLVVVASSLLRMIYNDFTIFWTVTNTKLLFS